VFFYVIIFQLIMGALNQAWAFLRYMTAINYLDMKMLDDKTKILYMSSVYSLILNSRAKKILGPAGDLQMGQIVLVEDLAVS
jgi:hypothetical protein